MTTPDSLYEALRAERLAPYQKALDGSMAGAACVAASGPLPAQARDALGKSLERLGFSPAQTTFVNCSALPEGSLLNVIEALDPLCVILCDHASVKAASRAYHTPLALESKQQLLGRPACCFDDFAALLATEAGKHRAWAALKTLGER